MLTRCRADYIEGQHDGAGVRRAPGILSAKCGKSKSRALYVVNCYHLQVRCSYPQLAEPLGTKSTLSVGVSIYCLEVSSSLSNTILSPFSPVFWEVSSYTSSSTRRRPHSLSDGASVANSWSNFHGHPTPCSSVQRVGMLLARNS